MPARKWIHRSRNRKPDSVNSAIEPSLERTAGQAPLSRVVVEVLVLLFVVVELVLVQVVVLVLVIIIVIIEVLVVVIEVLVVFVVLFLLGFGVFLGVQGILL